MFLSEPRPTGYDWEFSFFGFPVRVHPAFFIMPLLLGQGLISPDVNTGVGLIFVTLIFFVSILIHELGHAVAYRFYGLPARIVLYWMGGLAIAESGNAWGSQRTHSLTPNQRIVISLAGPVFGFLLALVLVLIVYALQGSITINNLNFMPLPQPDLTGTMLEKSDVAFMVIWGGIIINIVLNLFNLIPIYPLDGGQIARQIMHQMDSFNGIRNSIMLSIACAILIAVVSIMNGARFMGFFFGFMAWTNFQTLQQYGGGGSRW